MLSDVFYAVLKTAERIDSVVRVHRLDSAPFFDFQLSWLRQLFSVTALLHVLATVAEAVVWENIHVDIDDSAVRVIHRLAAAYRLVVAEMTNILQVQRFYSGRDNLVDGFCAFLAFLLVDDGSYWRCFFMCLCQAFILSREGTSRSIVKTPWSEYIAWHRLTGTW